MKKVFALFLALAIGFGLKAQCPLTQAVDFTATDIHGNEIHLFDILDGGQAVLIDFFFTTCGPCQQATPKIVDSYYAFGCNQHDVFYMEISSHDSDAACQNWCQNYGVEYPTISGVAGGSGICSTYQIGAYPTVILIMPNRQIVIRDLWPINSAQDVITALEAQGIQQHECGGTEGLTITPDTLYMIQGCIIENGILTIANTTDEDVSIHSFTADSIFYLECWHDYENVTNGMTVASGDTVEIEVIVDVPVKLIFTGKMYIETSVGNYEVEMVLDWQVGVGENAKHAVALFPNPANDFVTLKGESLGRVCVYNVLGQKVEELEAGGTEIRINTTGYENGVYFVKMGETTQRFVVQH